MAETVTTVKLRAWDGVKAFPVEQAERLLTMAIRGGSGWTLADPDWELVGDALRKKTKPKGKKED